MVVYAHWKKGGNTATANKIVGSWAFVASSYSYYHIFYGNGNFTSLYYYYSSFFGSSMSKITGKYSTSNGIVYFTNLMYPDTGTKLKDKQYKYSFGKDGIGEFLLTPPLNRDDSSLYTETLKFRK